MLTQYGNFYPKTRQLPFLGVNNCVTNTFFGDQDIQGETTILCQKTAN